MFPLLIDTNPINGSENIPLPLNQIILSFSDLLNADYLADATIRLTNYNTNTNINIEYASSPEGTQGYNEIAIYPLEELTQLTEYRLTISGLVSLSGELMKGTIEVRFTTEEQLANIFNMNNVSEVETPTDVFSVTMSYPKDNTVVTPEVIRIKCSEAIDENLDTTGIVVIEGFDIEEALFFGLENLVSNIIIKDDILEITTSSLKPATEYSVEVSGLISKSGALIEDYKISFITQPSPMYAEMSDIKRVSSVAVLIKGSSDVDVMNMISDNSSLAMFLAEQAKNIDIDWNDPPLYVVKYVETKTQYDIIFDKIIKLSSGDSTSKQLKDLTIEYGFSLSDLLKLADNLKQAYLYWEDFISKKTKGSAMPAVFRRGENADEVPEYKNRGLKDMEGERSW